MDPVREQMYYTMGETVFGSCKIKGHPDLHGIKKMEEIYDLLK